MTDLDDFLDDIRQGDAGAFGLWLARAEPTLRESLRSFARSVDTEAVVQEAALTLWNLARAGRVRADGKGNSLLRLGVTIARHRAIDMERKYRRVQPGPAPSRPESRPGQRGPDGRPGTADPGHEGSGPAPAKSLGPLDAEEIPDPGDAYPDPFLQKRIQLCVGRLRSKLRQALGTFVEHAGRMTLAEMSRQAGGQTAAAFRQSLSRARKAMAACLREHGVERW